MNTIGLIRSECSIAPAHLQGKIEQGRIPHEGVQLTNAGARLQSAIPLQRHVGWLVLGQITDIVFAENEQDNLDSDGRALLEHVQLINDRRVANPGVHDINWIAASAKKSLQLRR